MRTSFILTVAAVVAIVVHAAPVPHGNAVVADTIEHLQKRVCDETCQGNIGSYLQMLPLSQDDYESGLTKWTEYVNTNNLDLNNEDDLNTFLDEVIKYYFPDSSQGGSPDGSSDGSPDGSSGGSPDGSSDGSPDGSSGGSPDGSSDGSPDGSSGGSPDGSSGGSPDGSSDGSSGGSSDGSPDGQQGEGTKEP